MTNVRDELQKVVSIADGACNALAEMVKRCPQVKQDEDAYKKLQDAWKEMRGAMSKMDEVSKNGRSSQWHI